MVGGGNEIGGGADNKNIYNNKKIRRYDKKYNESLCKCNCM